MSFGQIDILIWWKENYRDLTLTTNQLYDNLKEETNFDSKKGTLTTHLGRLKRKNLIESPSRGEYELTSKGVNKAIYHEEGRDQGGLTDNEMEVERELEAFIFDEKQDEIEKLQLTSESLVIEVSELAEYNLALDEFLEENTDRFLEMLEKILEEEFEVESFKLHDSDDYYRRQIFNARDASLVDEIVTVHGTIRSETETFIQVKSIDWECVECGKQFRRFQDSKGAKSPYKCDCGSKKFDKVRENRVNVIEFSMSGKEAGTESIKAVFKSQNMTESMNEILSPGNEVKLTGVLRQEGDDQRNYNPILEILDYRKEERDVMESMTGEEIEEIEEKLGSTENLFEKAARSIEPSIVQQEDMKKVILASLIGSSPERDAQGEIKSDGRIHSMILSNPGAGKSKVLQWLREKLPKAYFADGQNATGTALTAAVEQDDGKWRVRAGKLALADGGYLALDEFDKMNAEDATRMNTALQSTTFSIDKASITTELPSKTTIIAAGNFEDYLEEEEPAFTKLPNHADSLMDRFDLKLALRSQADEEEVTETILSSYGKQGNQNAAPLKVPELRLFIRKAQQYEPSLSQPALELIQKWITGQKNVTEIKSPQFKGDSNRYIATLGKLTTMFARARFSDEATKDDVKSAVQLFQLCRDSMGVGYGETEKTVKAEVTQ